MYPFYFVLLTDWYTGVCAWALCFDILGMPNTSKLTMSSSDFPLGHCGLRGLLYLPSSLSDVSSHRIWPIAEPRTDLSHSQQNTLIGLTQHKINCLRFTALPLKRKRFGAIIYCHNKLSFSDRVKSTRCPVLRLHDLNTVGSLLRLHEHAEKLLVNCCGQPRLKDVRGTPYGNCNIGQGLMFKYVCKRRILSRKARNKG